MSTSVGILNLDRTPVDRDILGRMIESTAYCGPAGVRYWTSGCVGLAVTSFDTKQRSLDRYQLVSNLDGTCWITVDARLENREELIQALSSQDAHLGNSTDAELILAAYEMWQTDCPQHIAGSFAFAIWDSKRERLFCTRDRMGTRSLYYHFKYKQRFLWATECKQLLRHPHISGDLDERMIGAHLRPCPGQQDWSFFAEIAQLPPAHFLCLDVCGLHIERYWDIDVRHQIHYRSDAEYEEHFRSLFQEVVASHLHSAGPTGILLSGGIDSQSIACVGGKLIREQALAEYKDRLWAFTWVSEDPSECTEWRYTDLAVRAYDLVSEHIPVDSYWPLSGYGRQDTVPDDPTLRTCPPLLRATLQRARDLGVRTILTGGGADFLGLDLPNYVDLLQGFRWHTFWRDLRQHKQRTSVSWPRFAWRYLVRPALSTSVGHVLRHPLKLPKWVEPSFARRIDLRGIERESLPRKRFRKMSKLRCYLAVTNELTVRSAIAESRIFNEYGLDYRLPWRDVRLFEFIMAIPVDQTWRAGESKHLVRRAMRGIVPQAVRTTPNVPSITPLIVSGYCDRGRDAVEALLENPLLAEYGFVDAAVLREEYRRCCNGLRRLFPINYAIHLEAWLRQMSEVGRI